MDWGVIPSVCSNCDFVCPVNCRPLSRNLWAFLVLHCVSEKDAAELWIYLWQFLTDFQMSFTVEQIIKLSTQLRQYFPPILKCVVTLPCETHSSAFVTNEAKYVLPWTGRKLEDARAIRQPRCQWCFFRCHAERATDVASAHRRCEAWLVDTLLDDTQDLVTH